MLDEIFTTKFLIQLLPLGLALGLLWLRMEHRLTKIETDVGWLKRFINDNYEQPKE